MAPSDKATSMLRLFRSMPNIDKNMFLSSFFKTTPEDITDADFITLDIIREDEEMAPVLTDISTDAHVISEDIYTNKTIKPPAIALKEPFNVFDLLNRQAGETEYQAADGQYQSRLRVKIIRSWERMAAMIKRTIEFQAAQVLQTGTLTLPDALGNPSYILNYLPKATHFPDAAIAWGAVGSAPLVDINNLSEVIRDDGLIDVKNLIMGIGAFGQFMANADVQKIFFKNSFALGTLSPRLLASGATIQGFIPVGNYQYNIWTYGGRAIRRDTGIKTQYLDVDSCILLPDPEDLDFRRVYGGIPVVVDSVPEFRDVLPSRVTVPGAFDFKPRIYTDEAMETVYSEIKSRPLCIPVSIDRYGCIDTNPTT